MSPMGGGNGLGVGICGLGWEEIVCLRCGQVAWGMYGMWFGLGVA